MRCKFPGARVHGAILALALAAAVPSAGAQKATEMFIPIGQSAGLSGKHTMLAQVQAVNETQRTLTMLHNGTPYTVRLGARTPVWIDRSKQQQANSTGTLAEVKPGMSAEIKFEKNNRAAEVEWIKVQAAP